MSEVSAVGKGCCFYLITQYTEELADNVLHKIRHVYRLSFPDEDLELPACSSASGLPASSPCQRSAALEHFLTCVTRPHEPIDCVWFLLWLRQGDLPDLAGELVGMATGVPYHESLYMFNLAVLPSHRKLGLGRRLLHEAQAYALLQGLHKLSGTVDTMRSHLQRFYESLGGKMVLTGVGNSNGQPPPSIRMEKSFHAEEVAACIATTDADIQARYECRPCGSHVSNLAGRLAIVSGVVVRYTLAAAVLAAAWVVVRRRRIRQPNCDAG